MRPDLGREGSTEMGRFRLGLVAVWLLTGVLGTGLVDMVIEPDPSLGTQILLVVLLPLIAIPAVIGVFSLGWPRRERDDPR